MKSVWIIWLLFPVIHLNGQVTKIRGTVKDAVTGESLPFVSITLMGTTAGTVSDYNGAYFLESRLLADSIMVSFIGYKTRTIGIRKNIFQTIDITLEPDFIQMDEVVIVPGENPAHRILRNIIKNKERNDPRNIPGFQCEVYTKIQVDLNNVDDKFRNRKMFKQFQFVFENIDTNTITGKAYLPLMLAENLSDFYYQKEPRKQREVIKASQISGIKNQSISQFAGRMSVTFNIYDNFMTLYESGFVSPISDAGLAYYKYYLIDSADIDGHWCYQISFKPQRKQERTFFGDFWVADEVWAVKKMQMRLAKDANLNYINELAANFSFSTFNDSLWFLDFEELLVDFNITETQKIKGFFGRKTSYYRKYIFNLPLSEKIEEQKNYVVLADSALNNDPQYWDTVRPVSLTDKEARIYATVDSIKKVPLYKTAEDFVYLLTNYHFIIGPWEIGPYYTLYSFNEIEGNRFKLGGRTANSVSTKFMFTGHVAYGMKDEKIKYGAGGLYMFSKNPRIALNVSYRNDMEQLGQSINAFRTDNLIASVFRRNPDNKLTLTQNFTTAFEREWYQGFAHTLYLTHKRIYPTYFIPFYRLTDGQINNVSRIICSEIMIQTHYAYDEIFVMGEFERRTLGTKYPVIDLYLTAGIKDLALSQYEYYKTNLRISHFFNTNPFGFFKYTVDAGRIFGHLPFPLLELHRGNETYAYDYYAFNMMNYYEFVSDQWVSIWGEQHLQGFFLNHIPLLRKLRWREVVSAKGLIGSLNDRNRDKLLFPPGLGDVTQPYGEASVGIENIFKFFRFDAVWRLTHLDHPNIQIFGLRAKLQVIF